VKQNQNENFLGVNIAKHKKRGPSGSTSRTRTSVRGILLGGKIRLMTLKAAREYGVLLRCYAMDWRTRGGWKETGG